MPEPAHRTENKTMEPKLFVATKAFIVKDGKVLVLKESAGHPEGANEGRLDVVGGRIQLGEKLHDALAREVREETALTVEVGTAFFVNEWFPVVHGAPYHIVGIFFECTPETDAIRLSNEHDEYKWIEPENYAAEDLIPNLRAAFEAYLKRNPS